MNGREFRILVTGSREATKAAYGQEIETAIHEAVMNTSGWGDEPVVIVHGDQKGVDQIAAEVAAYWPLTPNPRMRSEPHNARDFGNWPAAGPRRNAHMVSLGADICLAFPLPGSRGTWDCARKAADAGIRVILRTLHGDSP